MSPVVKKKKNRFTLPGKYLLMILAGLCVLLMIITFRTDLFEGPLRTVAGYVVVPFQEGIASVGGYLYDRAEEMGRLQEALDENERLQEEIANLTMENAQLQQDRYELEKLRELYDIDEVTSDYEKTGARVIASDGANWFYSFTIDKGSEDGIRVDMNVIAGGGLVGIITSVGPNWARVTSIISDNSNVSAKTLATEDNLIVSGDLQLMADGVITFSMLVDSRNAVTEGDKVVTSDISDKFLPNILIGYINTINRDSNNLTKSGYITPAVDFEHLGEVLVITDLKQQVVEEEE